MLPSHPAIVGGVTDKETLEALPDLGKLTADCDLLEFRIDALLEQSELLEGRLKQVSHPLPIQSSPTVTHHATLAMPWRFTSLQLRWVARWP